MLFEQKRKQHQHPSVMHDPPHIDAPFIVTLVVTGVEGHIFGDQQGEVCCGGATDSVWSKRKIPDIEDRKYYHVNLV